MFHVKHCCSRLSITGSCIWWTGTLLLLAIFLFTACGVSNNPDGWAGPVAIGEKEGSGIVVTRAGSDKLIAIDLSSRTAILGDTVTVAWEFPNSDGGFPGLTKLVTARGFYGAPAFLGPEQKEIVFGDYAQGVVYALRTDGSSARVLLETEDRILAGVLTDPDSNTVYVATTNERIYAVKAENPPQSLEQITARGGWESQEILGEVWGTPALAESTRHGRIVVIPAMSGNLYALRADDGSLLWTFSANAALASTVAIYGERAYIGSFDHMFYSIDLNSGEPIWVQEGSGWFWTTARIDENTGVVYAGDLSGKVWAWLAEDGQPLWPWPYNAEGQLRARPLLLEDPFALVVVTRAGNVHAIDPRSGDKIWASNDIEGLTIPDLVLADPMAWADFILVSNDKGRLFEVRVGVNAFRELVPARAASR